MIEINNFKEAYQLHQTNQIAFPVLQDIAYIVMNICEPPSPSIVNTSSELNAELLYWLTTQEASEFSFNMYLGGNAYICESEPDLKNIKAFDQAWADEHGEWPDVTDLPMVWDVCYTLNDEWAVFAYLWNNAGGDTFYVPKYLWQQARIAEHLQLNPT